MPQPSMFSEKKRKILQELNRPDEEYKDLSPIGAVDPNIRQLVNQINETDDYVTTSSCAGRISVFLEGAAKTKNDQDDESPNTSSSNQGKGGGKWLFVSHDPVDVKSVSDEGALLRLFQLPNAGTKISFPPASTEDKKIRFVHFKFEPMILHILASSLTSAQRCLSSALSAGFRESGIVGVTGSEPTPHVGIRTQGLALESLIAWQDPDTEEIHPMVSEGYLRTLVDLANQRFVANEERKERFAKDLLLPKGEEKTKKGDAGEWEDKDVRRERKRQEGLRRREKVERQRRALEAQPEARDGNDGDLGVEGSQVHESVAKGDPLPAKKPKMLGERGYGPVVH